MGIYVSPRPWPLVKISATQIVPLQDVGGIVASKSGTVTGTAGVGSSLFLQRLCVPGAMTITEIQAAMSIGFPATNQGAGTMSRTMVVYNIGNSTSLATLCSASGTSAWNTGTSTAGASSSLTQFQGGWSSPLIQPMTFASSTLDAGEYVVGQLFNFAQGSSTWTLNFYGKLDSLTSATLGALSSGGLAAVSAYTATTGSALTAWTAAPSPIPVAKGVSTATIGTTTNSALSISTANSTFSLIMNAGTGAFGAISSAGLSAGSFIGTSGSLSAVTNVANTFPNFGFLGTGSTTSGFPTVFFNGIMSTGGVPANIELTSAAVTYSGSIALQQPWFALIGS